MKYYYDVIDEPIISEKSMANAAEKRYTFKVKKDSTKTEIRQAIEDIFDVSVKKVNTANFAGKLKRQGRSIGRRASYKKAIVTLTKDSKEIEVFAGL